MFLGGTRVLVDRKQYKKLREVDRRLSSNDTIGDSVEGVNECMQTKGESRCDVHT